jgi:hypothetical protein
MQIVEVAQDFSKAFVVGVKSYLNRIEPTVHAIEPTVHRIEPTVNGLELFPEKRHQFSVFVVRHESTAVPDR